jgi:hypothetical protein
MGLITSLTGCAVHLTSPLSEPIPVDFRLFFNEEKAFALIRLRVSIVRTENPLFLHIAPEHIQDLSLSQGPPPHIDLSATDISLIAPQEPLHLFLTDEERYLVERLLFLIPTTSKSVLRITMPDGSHKTPHIKAFCNAFVSGGLQSDPDQTALNSLYRGAGGRNIEHGRNLWPPPYLFATSRAQDTSLPPTLPATDDYPPSYAGTLSTRRYSTRTPSPCPAKKRTRSSTPSLSPFQYQPNTRESEHLDIRLENYEKKMDELLQRCEERENHIQNQLQLIQTREAIVEKKIAHLESLLSDSGGDKLISHNLNHVQRPHLDCSDRNKCSASQATTMSPTASEIESPTKSTSLDNPDQIMAYVDFKIEELRSEIYRDFSTTKDVNLIVDDQIDSAIFGLVKEDDMLATVETSIEEAKEQIKSRILDAFL